MEYRGWWIDMMMILPTRLSLHKQKNYLLFQISLYLGQPFQIKFQNVQYNIYTIVYDQFTYSFNSLITETAVAASSPVVGSSRNMISGEIINSIPMLVRFFCPPDIPLINSVPVYI